MTRCLERYLPLERRAARCLPPQTKQVWRSQVLGANELLRPGPFRAAINESCDDHGRVGTRYVLPIAIAVLDDALARQ